MDRYKDMAGSKGRTFVLQHCYKILEHCLKWKTRYQEIIPMKGALLELDDSEDDSAGGGAGCCAAAGVGDGGGANGGDGNASFA
jgi:hypothetical protein